MLSYFKRFRKEGTFANDAAVTISWNGAIIAVQIFLSPIVTRIYSPAEYGMFAIFNSIVLNLSLFGSLKYHEAVVLADSEKEKNNLIAIAFSFNALVTVLTLAVVTIFRQEITEFIGFKDSSLMIFLLPLCFSIGCLIEVMVVVNIRRKMFNRNGLAGFLSHFTSRLSNILYSLIFSARAAGLILGDLTGKLFCVSALIFRSRSENMADRKKNFLSSISIPGIRAVAFKFKSFPLYFLPSYVLASFSGHLPLYFFQGIYGSSMVGTYALASSMMEMLNRLIPYSLAPVLLKKASDLKNVSHEILCDRVYKLFLVMLAIATCIFSGICVLGRIVFPFVFGESWIKAGIFAGLIAIPYCYNFIAVALSEVYNVLQRQRFLLANTILNFVLKGLAIAIFVFLNTDEETALMIFSGISAVGGLFLVLGVFVILKYRVWQATALLILSLLVLFVSYAAGKYLIFN